MVAEERSAARHMKGFKAFLLRGNVVDLAIAIVIGVAFGAVITALVKDLLTPLIAAIGGKPNFAALNFTINKSTFLYGDFINAVIAFVILAAVVYYFVVLPYTRFQERFQPAPDSTPTKDCPFCLSSIPEKATRCLFCTSDVSATTAQ
jgi:large conductance mechanosensitive channel